MAINLDNIQPIAAVTIGICSTMTETIEIKFVRMPDADVLSDIRGLERYPGFQVYNWSRSPNSFEVCVSHSSISFQVAERIAQSLEKDHHLIVQRLVSDPNAIDKSPCKPVPSFV